MASKRRQEARDRIARRHERLTPFVASYLGHVEFNPATGPRIEGGPFVGDVNLSDPHIRPGHFAARVNPARATTSTPPAAGKADTVATSGVKAAGNPGRAATPGATVHGRRVDRLRAGDRIRLQGATRKVVKTDRTPAGNWRVFVAGSRLGFIVPPASHFAIVPPKVAPATTTTTEVTNG